MIFTKTILNPDDAAVNKNTNRGDQTMNGNVKQFVIDDNGELKEFNNNGMTMADIKSGKGLSPIGNNTDGLIVYDNGEFREFNGNDGIKDG